MGKRLILLFAVAALAAGFSGGGFGQSDPTGTVTVSVDARAGDGPPPFTGNGVFSWVDSGFDLKPLAPAVTVTATGIAQFCPTAGVAGAGGCSTNPDGTAFNGGAPLVPGGCPACPLPGVVIGTLIGWTAVDGAFVVGSSTTLAGKTGRLFLAYQDGFGAHFDNSGSYTVTITFPCQPGNGNGDKNHYHCGPPGQG